MKSRAPSAAALPPTMLTHLESDVVFIVHSDVPPTDADWNGYVDWLKGSSKKVRGVLVFTDGPGPDPEQRANLAAVDGVTRILTAVVTGSIKARGIATAFSWFGHRIRAFKPSDLESAFTYLDVPSARRRDYLEQIAAMRARLAGVDLDESADGIPTSATRESMRRALIDERLQRVRERVAASKRSKELRRA